MALLLSWKHVTHLRKLGVYKYRDPYNRWRSHDFSKATYGVEQVLFQPELIFYPNTPSNPTQANPAYYENLPRGSILHFDEASSTPTLSSHSWFSLQNELIGIITQTQGYRLINLVFVEPNIDELTVNVVRQLHVQVLTIERQKTYGIVKIYVFQMNPDGKLWRYWWPRRNVYWRVPPPPFWLADAYEQKKKQENRDFFGNLALKVQSEGSKMFGYYSPEYANRLRQEQEDKERKLDKTSAKANKPKRQHYRFEEGKGGSEEVLLDNGRQVRAFNEFQTSDEGAVNRT